MAEDKTKSSQAQEASVAISKHNNWGEFLRNAGFKTPEHKQIFDAFNNRMLIPDKLAAAADGDCNSTLTQYGIPEGEYRVVIKSALSELLKAPQRPPVDTSTTTSGSKKRKAFDTSASISNLHATLSNIDLGKLCDSKDLFWLQFPVAGDYAPPERFAVNSRGQFPVIGRACLKQLEDEVKTFLQNGQLDDNTNFVATTKVEIGSIHQAFRKFLIYGNTGAGKSHLIMMLALRLRAEFLKQAPVEMRVVIVPSAAAVVAFGWEYLLTAVKLSCADSSVDLDLLNEVEDADQLAQFCQQQSTRFVFVVDQADVLERDQLRIGDNAISAIAADTTRKLLQSVTGARNFVIYGASANNETAKNRFAKQQDIQFYDIFGGFTLEETKLWLEHFSLQLDATQIDTLFDYTSGVPLYLHLFWRNFHKGDTFEVAWQRFTVDKVLAETIAAVENWVASSSSKSGFEELVSAFLLQGSLPAGASENSYDHRYFYVEQHEESDGTIVQTCNHVAGFVRNQLAQSLRHHKGHTLFASHQWNDKVKAQAASPNCNKSVLGFLAEQAVISALATGSLVFKGQTYQFANNILWISKGNEKSHFSAKERTTGLYLPAIFNYPNVDLVFSAQETPRPLRVGVQITLQDYASHKKSATKFMSAKKCEEWLCTDKAIGDYDWYFVWVMSAKKLGEIKTKHPLQPIQHNAVTHKTRARSGKAQGVPFVEYFLTFSQISPSLAVLDSL